MRQSARPCGVSVFLALATSVMTGCAQQSFNFRPGGQALRPPRSPAVAQYRDMHSRAAGLDADNQHLMRFLAQQQQQNQQMQAAAAAVAAGACRGPQPGGGGGGRSVARRVSAPAASHGGALPVVRIPGADVEQDGDLVRIRVESALFGSGRAELKPDVGQTLDRIAQAASPITPAGGSESKGTPTATPSPRASGRITTNLPWPGQWRTVPTALKQLHGVPEAQLFVAGLWPQSPRDRRQVETGQVAEPARRDRGVPRTGGIDTHCGCGGAESRRAE